MIDSPVDGTMPRDFTGMKIALIGCSKTKAAQCDPLPARSLYQGRLFRKQLAYAERVYKADLIFVLSAFYGAVEIDQHICRYDWTIGQLSKAERVEWGYEVQEDIAYHIPPGVEVEYCVLAPRHYIRWLSWLPPDTLYPLRPYPGYGYQLQWLNSQL